MDRTIISAEANSAGLYPPVGPRNWNGEAGERVQLVPVHTVPRSQDNVRIVFQNSGARDNNIVLVLQRDKTRPNLR